MTDTDTSIETFKQLEKLEGQNITGAYLNQILNGVPLLKFMNDDDIHHGMKYKTGHNLDILSFNGTEECSPGGIYVTTIKDCHSYDVLDYGRYARRVFIGPNTLVHVERRKFKCDEVYLGERVLKEELIKQLVNECFEKGISDIFCDQKFRKYIDDKFRTPGFVTKCFLNCHYIHNDFNADLVTNKVIIDVLKKDLTKIKMFYGLFHDDSYHERLLDAIRYIFCEFLNHRNYMSVKIIIHYEVAFIKCVDEKYMTDELIIDMVKSNSGVLSYIGEKYLSASLMIRIIKEIGSSYAAYFIPKYLTPEVLECAVANGFRLVDIGNKSWPPELLLSVVKKDPCIHDFIKYLDKDYMIPEPVLELIRHDHRMIDQIEKRIKCVRIHQRLREINGICNLCG